MTELLGDSNLIADEIIKCLMNTSILREESIEYMKLLSNLVPMASVRRSIRTEHQIIPALLLSAQCHHDPTDFYMEAFEIMLKLLLEHPVEVSAAMSNCTGCLLCNLYSDVISCTPQTEY